MARLIDAEKAKFFIADVLDIFEVPVGDRIADRLLKTIDAIPTVDAVEVVHGEWSRLEDDYCGITALVCSECNREYWFEDEPPMKIYNYCPNCGAKMDGDGDGS